MSLLFSLALIVAAVVVACLVARLAARRPLHPPHQGRDRREAVGVEGLAHRGPHPRGQRRGRLPDGTAPRRRARVLLPVAVPHPPRAARLDPGGQDRLRLLARRPAARPDADARPRGAVQQLPGRPRVPRRRRAARPPAGDPARRRLRHQPRALRRRRRGPRLPGPRPREEPGHLRGVAGADARARRVRPCRGRHRVGRGARRHGRAARGRFHRHPAARRQHRHRDRARRPAHRVGRDHRARGARGRGPGRPRLLPGPRGAARARRPPRQAAPGADRRHLLRQPLVRDGGVQAEDGHPDRLRRRRRVLLRAPRRGPDRRPVPLRRAGRARAGAACGGSRCPPESTRSTRTR